MNGKKARLLRSLAGTRADAGKARNYNQSNKVTRPIYTQELLASGQVVRKLSGTFETCTFTLSAGSRYVYKTLKKSYKTAIKRPQVA